MTWQMIEPSDLVPIIRHEPFRRVMLRLITTILLSQTHMSDPAVQSASPVSPSAFPSHPPLHFRGELIKATHSYLEGLHDEWQQLARQHPHREPFLLPYWFEAFAKTIAREEALPLVTVRADERLCGVLPLRRTGRFLGKVPARVLSSLSNVHSCRYDFMCDPNHVEGVARAAWQVLKNEPGWNVIEALAIPEGGAFEAILRCAAHDGYMTSRWPTLLSPFLSLPSDPSDPFGNSPSQYKKDRKRIEKRFERLREFGEPTFEVHSGFDEDKFNEFLTLEASGWKGHAGGAISCNRELVDFYRELLHGAANQNHLRLCELRVGDKPVAMELAFVVDGRCYSPKIAYDENFADASPGQQLARLAITDLVKRGIKRYDLLGPRARHKALWAGDVRPHANCYIFRPSLAGRVYYYIIDKVGPRVKKAKHARSGDPQSL